MTDITNTKITRKTESYGNDYKAMKTEAMILQKKGAPFMMASVVIWTLVTIVRMLPVDVMTKNLYTFYCPGMLLPCVLIFSKIIGAHVFKNRKNPFNKLGFINTANQMLYLLIVMWASIRSRMQCSCFSRWYSVHIFCLSHGSTTARHISLCHLLRHSVLCSFRSLQARFMSESS